MTIYKRNLPTLFNRDEFITPFDHIFDKLMQSSFPEFTNEFGLEFFEKGSYPKVDIVEYRDKILIEAEIPGLDKNDLSIEVKNSTLIISGEKKIKEKQENIETKYIRRELKRSRFQRSFNINEDILDINKIDAKFENGVLFVILPKKEINKQPEVCCKVEIK